MARPYHTYEELVPGLVTATDMVQLTNDALEEDGGGEVVMAVWEGARADADALIDGYLGERYEVPLATVPELVRRISCGLTRFYLYERRYQGEVPKGVQNAHDRQVELLKGLAAGKPSLGLQPAPSPNAQRAARLISAERVFTVDTLKDF